MTITSRTITGALATLFGLILIALGILKDPGVLVFGIPIVIIGIVIFFNKKEDVIEEIKSRKE
jgi:uncharacterized membrane protein|tara:strand:+ start:79486 stop:79674 length:189 start_codon:yes stop_codon:yes gene_type:complete